MKKIWLVALLWILAIVGLALAQSSAYGMHTWIKTCGGYHNDKAESIRQTTDSGFIVAGTTQSFDAENGEYYAGSRYDGWLLKLDSAGEVAWQKGFGLGSQESFSSVIKTLDGNYIVTGESRSSIFPKPDKERDPNAPYIVHESTGDIWILKVDSSGTVLWQKAYGTGDDCRIAEIKETADGGLIVAASVLYYLEDHTAMLIMRLDSQGGVVWQKTYETIGIDGSRSIDVTNDGGYIVGGHTYWGTGMDQAFILKLDSNGNIEWQNRLSELMKSFSYIDTIRQTADGGYIMIGDTSNISGFWVVKFTSTGSISWQKSFEGEETTSANDLIETASGNYIVAGHLGTTNYTGDIHDMFDNIYDALLLEIDGNGTIVTQKRYGGGEDTRAHAIIPVTGGGYVLAGSADTLPSGSEDQDLWVAKVDSNGTIPECTLQQDATLTASDASEKLFSCNATIGTVDIQVRDTDAVIQSSTATAYTACENLSLDPCPAEVIYGPGSSEAGLFRELRDRVVTGSLAGTALVRLYYQLSPVISESVNNHEKVQTAARQLLDPIVSILRDDE